MNHKCDMQMVVRYFLFLILFTIKRNYAFPRNAHPIELTIDSGSIRGEYLREGANDFAVFKGIPYAAPPVGALRFQLPEPPPNWLGVMNATSYSAMCTQKPRNRKTDPIFKESIHTSEDCLYLNVFGPPPFTNDTYPVIVWIHGGNFQSGSSADYSQEAILNNFVSRKIIFITFNYRLGPLGFMSTGDDVIPGNNGLWDQIYALKWVQKNAHVFGGDPNNVVLMGHGSGAASASILALSPRAEGLFHRIILMSGTALTPGIIRSSAINATWNLDRKLHCRSFNSSELIQCFRKQLEKEIIEAVDSDVSDYEDFVPIIDGKSGIIPETAEMLATYRPKVPLMLGTTRDESALKLVILNEKKMNESGMSKMTAELLVQNLTDSFSFFKNQRLIIQGCMHEYIWKKVSPAYGTSVLYNSVLEMFSHFWYDAPASRLASYYARDVPVYLYSFDHISENLDYDRAFHGCDQIFLFEFEPRFLSKRSDRNWQLDRRLTEIFSELIVNFAKYSVPTPEAAGFSFNWTSMNVKYLNYLSITDNPSMNVGFRWQGHVFWNSYVRDLDDVDVGNLQKIAQLERKLGYFQLATWTLLISAAFFFTILVGLACYCTRKENEEEDL